jgi:hypothetical protein
VRREALLTIPPVGVSTTKQSSKLDTPFFILIESVTSSSMAWMAVHTAAAA